MDYKPASIKGINVYPFKSDAELIDYVADHPSILIAINAEKVINADRQLTDLVNSNIGYCDGAGAVKAMHRKGYPDAVRIPGCELWLKIIDRFHTDKTFYLIGAKPGIVDEVVTKIRATYPGIKIIGYRDGYINTDNEKEALLNDIKQKQPGIVFVAMGSPKQEMLMKQMRELNPGAIYQGLGGSFDVYSGHQQRAPRWWREHNLEFLYRFIITPSRLTRLKPYLQYAIRLYTNRL